MFLRNKRALSPVISGIILVADTVAVAIAATTWLGSMSFSFMSTEEIQVENCQWAQDASYADLTVRNFGTGKITLESTQVSKNEARERVGKLLEMVGMEPSRAKNYPHEFSGGMRQRAMIAMALASNPDILIADEPGTALDVIVQAQVLKLLNELKKRLNLSIIMITHDLSLITETCEKLVIMYAGNVAEYGSVLALHKEALHPYTQDLIFAFPDIHAEKHRMSSIPGSPPDLLQPPSGCRFHPRCKYAMDICRKEMPKLKKMAKDHYVACHLSGA